MRARSYPLIAYSPLLLSFGFHLSYAQSMMPQNRKSKEACTAELETCAENAKAYFGIELNLETLQGQLGDMVAEKIASYYYQRFRDWNVHDLLALREVLAERIKDERPRAGMTTKQALRAAKKEGSV